MDDPRVDSEHMRDAGSKANLLDYAGILLAWKNFIIINVAAITVLAIVISLLLPKWYRATASILPPREQDFTSSLGAASSVLKGLGATRKITGFSQNLGPYNYLAILKSRNAMEAVARKFDLATAYDVGDSSMEKTIKELRNNTAFEIQDDDYTTVEVLDKDPQRAADMANYFIEVLNELSIDLGTREARNNREFIQSRLGEAQTELRKAEDSVRVYQERSGMIVSPDPSSSGIGAIAELYGMKAKKEIELAIMKRTLAGDSPNTRQLQLELAELDRKLSTFPQIGIDSYRLYRNAAIQQKIVEYLVPLYEQARIDEQKDVPVLLVLDRAVVPERKAKPQRSLIVLSLSFLTFFFTVALVYLIHGVSRRSDTRNPLEMRLKKSAAKIASLYRVKVTA